MITTSLVNGKIGIQKVVPLKTTLIRMEKMGVAYDDYLFSNESGNHYS